MRRPIFGAKWVLPTAAAAFFGTSAIVILHGPSMPLRTQPAAEVRPPERIAAWTLPARQLGAGPILDPTRFSGPSAPLAVEDDAARAKRVERVPEAAPQQQLTMTEQIYSLSPPFEMLDSRTFVSGRWAVVLDGVEGPDRDAICINAEGRMFGCGLQARAALNNALRRGPVQCKPRAFLNPERMVADCTAGDGDLAAALIERGWLRPQGATSQTREAGSRAAEAASSGMWNGGWRIR